ncbi:DUF1330 domain-containing protein [Pantoea sp. Tr-811]|uniref:DUF1330 domain-containing protein n=1 Tax=Pantoea sp. Tr-811 TaxID=2608361 RepID=UPI001423F97B|nr:DUF1330 domain-containing protein [Pantoea sp. Tr-811]NIF28312.1 DUF1330 domain-containing protein [Pantoea sp. Tr-811]
MKGYWIIFGSSVIDTEAQQEYGRLWGPIADHYGAKIKVVDREAKLEVNADSRVLVVEFPSYAQAKACYEDPAYAHAKSFALRAAKRELILLEGDLN